MQNECCDAYCLLVRQQTGHHDPHCPECRGTGEKIADTLAQVGEMTTVTISARTAEE